MLVIDIPVNGMWEKTKVCSKQLEFPLVFSYLAKCFWQSTYQQSWRCKHLTFSRIVIKIYRCHLDCLTLYRVLNGIRILAVEFSLIRLQVSPSNSKKIEKTQIQIHACFWKPWKTSFKTSETIFKTLETIFKNFRNHFETISNVYKLVLKHQKPSTTKLKPRKTIENHGKP